MSESRSHHSRVARRKSWWSRQTGTIQASVIVAALGAVATIVAAILPTLLSEDKSEPNPPQGTADPHGSTPSPSAGSTLKAIDIVARDSTWTGEKFAPTAVEITVHNKGGRRSVITRVVVTVEDSSRIDACATEGGGIPLSGAYELSLPLDPAVGAEFRLPVSQQQGPDEADRFAIRLGIPDLGDLGPLYIYRLKFELEADGEADRVQAGTVVAALPREPNHGDALYYWSKEYDSGTKTLDWLDSETADKTEKCMKDQSQILRRLTSGTVELPPRLLAVASDLVE